MVLAKTAYQRYCQSHYFKCDNSWAYGHGGSSGNTIFNITKNYGYGGYGGGGCCFGGGSFWSGFGRGLGWGFGQGIVSFLSSFTPWNSGWMNWGTFAGSNPSMQFNWGDILSSKKAKKSEKPKETEKPKEEKETKKCEDIDSAKLADFMPKVTALEKKTSPTTDEIQKLYDEIKAAKDAQDDLHKTDDTKQYDDLLSRLTTLKTAAAPANNHKEVVPPPAQEGDDDIKSALDALTFNTLATDPTLPNTLPKDYEYATSATAKGKEFAQAKDLSGNTADVNNDTGLKTIGKYASTDFPLYLLAGDSKNYAYKCAKLIGDKAIYTTPSTDTNKNVYVLTIKDGKLHLLQCNDTFNGYGVGDVQSGFEIPEEEEE